MNDKLCYASLLMHDPNKVNYLLPFVLIINTQSTLNSHWDCNLASHLPANRSYLFWVKHQDRSECTLFHFSARAATIDVDFIVTPFLSNLSCLSHPFRVAAS